ncbi:hypothetical protein Ciccas_012102 [Cichlidogyrus casuarinus]|uniref:Uncharacterized protein n=1 Tax=Cichlidogyrus casuarinus TaxID=1844966 RepID=A0ABD2PR45_9PLAT
MCFFSNPSSQHRKKLSELSALTWYLRRGFSIEDLPSEYLKILIGMLYQKRACPRFPLKKRNDCESSDTNPISSPEPSSCESDDTYFAKAYARAQSSDSPKDTIPNPGLQSAHSPHCTLTQPMTGCCLICSRSLFMLNMNQESTPRCRSCYCPLRKQKQELGPRSSSAQSCATSDNRLSELCMNLCKLTGELVTTQKKLSSHLEQLSQNLQHQENANSPTPRLQSPVVDAESCLQEQCSRPDFLSLNNTYESTDNYDRLCFSLPSNYFNWSDQFIKVLAFQSDPHAQTFAQFIYRFLLHRTNRTD